MIPIFSLTKSAAMACTLIAKGNPSYENTASAAHFSKALLAKEATSFPGETTARESTGEKVPGKAWVTTQRSTMQIAGSPF